MSLKSALGAFGFAAALAAVPAQAIQLVATSDPGYYNNHIGTLLNGTDPAFPTSGDPTLNYPAGSPPNIGAASSVLGGWLNQPAPDLGNGFWTPSPIAIPNSWAVNTEVAIVYVFNSGGITGLQGSFGVDNGIFVWLDGVFKGGAERPGGVVPGEHVFNLGDLTAGTHYLQLLLEDHGSTNGYSVNITADTFIPPPPVIAEPATIALLGLGFVGLGILRRRHAI